MLGSLQHSIDKASSTATFSSEDAFPIVNWADKNLTLFINDSDSKEN